MTLVKKYTAKIYYLHFGDQILFASKNFDNYPNEQELSEFFMKYKSSPDKPKNNISLSTSIIKVEQYYLVLS